MTTEDVSRSAPMKDEHIFGSKSMNLSGGDDFTAEWTEKNGEVLEVRITKGIAHFQLPWYRRVLLKLLGCSHWQRVTIQRKGTDCSNKDTTC